MQRVKCSILLISIRWIGIGSNVSISQQTIIRAADTGTADTLYRWARISVQRIDMCLQIKVNEFVAKIQRWGRYGCPEGCI